MPSAAAQSSEQMDDLAVGSSLPLNGSLESKSSKQIMSMTVPQLREIVSSNKLGGEKSLKKELVGKVIEFY